MDGSNSFRWLRPLTLVCLALPAAAVSPLIFPAAQAGYENLNFFATRALIPAVAVLAGVFFTGRKWEPGLARSVLWGAVAGALATIPLEAVRIPGFLLGTMPGNLPQLMGVLLLKRFALGPSIVSDIAGWGYHFWNGASFGIIYVLLIGTSRRWAALVYALAIGVGFMVSPVVVALGVGDFGLQFSPWFSVTVLAAHVAFGLALGWLAQRFLASARSPLWAALHDLVDLDARQATQPLS